MLDLHSQISWNTRRRCFRGLVRVCGEYGLLPKSYFIPESKIEKLGEAPISVGGFSEVWPGAYEEEKTVAIKVMKYYTGEGIQTIKKARRLYLSFWSNLTVCRASAERSSL